MVNLLLNKINTSFIQINKKTDSLTTLQFLKQSWDQETQKTVQNCFQKGVFILLLLQGRNADNFVDKNYSKPKVSDDMTKEDFEEWTSSVDNDLQTSVKINMDNIFAANARVLEVQ